MGAQPKNTPAEVIELAARNLFRETSAYGFQQVDYIRFVNLLLDLSLSQPDVTFKKPHNTKIKYKPPVSLQLPLVGERVAIRNFQNHTDRMLLEKWMTDAHGRHFLLSRITAQNTDLHHLIDEPRNHLGIITLNDTRPIGVLAFLDYDQFQQKAELRKLIGEPEFRGKGLAKEATKMWIEYGIFVLGLKKIYLNTLDTNVRNIKLNEELGFQVEGILRNECLIDGVYHDVLKMGLWCEA